MEKLIAQGKIRRWGVSNLDHADMQELWQLPGGNQCATNQVLYHLGSRGIEYDLLPWCQQQQMPVMAYSPLAQAGRLRNGLLKNAVVNEIAHAHNISIVGVGNQPSGCDGDSKSGHDCPCPTECGCA